MNYPHPLPQAHLILWHTPEWPDGFADEDPHCTALKWDHASFTSPLDQMDYEAWTNLPWDYYGAECDDPWQNPLTNAYTPPF